MSRAAHAASTSARSSPSGAPCSIDLDRAIAEPVIDRRPRFAVVSDIPWADLRALAARPR